MEIGTYLTLPVVANYWNWAYRQMLVRSNTVIAYASKPELSGIWANEAEKNAIIAEAKFFRAYTHNFLANLYGDVPIVDTIYSAPKADFVRSMRKDVYQFAASDLEFASQWLPETVDKQHEGRIVKAAADHLLSEVYISLGEYDKAIASASKVINSGLYQLMTERFGLHKDEPVMWAATCSNQQSKQEPGNLETIYVWH